MNSHAQKAAARFDSWAGTYGDDRISAWFKYYQSLALSRFSSDQRSEFLDIGCGNGWAVGEMARQPANRKACGIDISSKMIAKAIRQSRGMRNVEFQIATSEEIPYPNESFRSVLCTCSFHHYRDPIRALSEIRRVMRKDAKLVIVDPARDASWAIWLQDRWRRHFEQSHVRYYTASEMTSLIVASELKLDRKIVEIKRYLDHGKVFTGLMLVECARR